MIDKCNSSDGNINDYTGFEHNMLTKC